MKTLPKQFYKYFWDTKPELIDIENKPDYVISRLIDYGHTSAISRLRGEYNDETMRKTLKTMRGMREKVPTT